MDIFKVEKATKTKISAENKVYMQLTDLLGIFQNNFKTAKKQ